MNGIHDMGGMICFGPVLREENEPVFHAPWERRTFALSMLALGGLANLDEYRRANELMDPAHYLTCAYYEHWLAAVQTILLEKGVCTKEELATGIPREGTVSAGNALPPEAIVWLVEHGVPANRQYGRTMPRFKPGDKVVGRNLNPTGHTRLPRYARGRRGVIERVNGTFPFPDTNAHGGGEQPQPVYCVRFDAIELWGAATAKREAVYVDLWEDYLEPA
jgi:nitrile hydratase